jgi:hypothetical protein
MAFTIRTDVELEAALDALAAAEGLSRQEVVRRAVLDRFRQSVHDDQVRESTQPLAKKWAVVLDRLGSEWVGPSSSLFARQQATRMVGHPCLSRPERAPDFVEQ